MPTTSVSLLERLRDPQDGDAWRRAYQLYAPLILSWLRRNPQFAADAEDVHQGVLTVLLRRLPEFDRRREGSFRRYLKRLTVTQLRNLARQRGRADGVEFLDAWEDPAGDLRPEADRRGRGAGRQCQRRLPCQVACSKTAAGGGRGSFVMNIFCNRKHGDVAYAGGRGTGRDCLTTKSPRSVLSIKHSRPFSLSPA